MKTGSRAWETTKTTAIDIAIAALALIGLTAFGLAVWMIGTGAGMLFSGWY